MTGPVGLAGGREDELGEMIINTDVLSWLKNIPGHAMGIPELGGKAIIVIPKGDFCATCLASNETSLILVRMGTVCCR